MSLTHPYAPAALPGRLNSLSMRAMLGLGYALPALALLPRLFPPINHDTGALLDFGRRWLAGERLYVDLLDMNTPITFVHYAVPVAIGNMLNLGSPAGVTIWFFLLIGLSFAAACRLMPRAAAGELPVVRHLALQAILFGLCALPADEFTQREHLMVILAVPYALVAAMRAGGQAVPVSLGIAVTLSASLGFVIKPHYVFVPLVIELYLLWQRGLRATLLDPAPWVIGFAYVGHLAAIVFLTPNYLGFVVPITLEYYTRLSHGAAIPPWVTGYAGATLVALLLLAPLVWGRAGSPLLRIAFLFALGGVFSDMAQAKGWYYHAIPGLFGIMFLLPTMGARGIALLAGDRLRQLDLPTAALSLFMAVSVNYTFLTFQQPFDKQIYFTGSEVDRLSRMVKKYAKRGRVLSLSPGIYPHFPMVNYAHASMTMPFMTMWLLQGVYAFCEEGKPLYNEPDRMEPAERFVYETVAANMARWKPGVVVVDHITGVPDCIVDSPFSYLDYFLRHPDFAAEWQNYEYIDRLGRFDIYARMP
ncbi:MAG: hypothetical protein OHK0024_11850 [Thalassobaculales bacterium]